MAVISKVPSFDVRYSWGYWMGYGSGTYVAESDILFQRNTSPTFPLSEAVNSQPLLMKYFDSDHEDFNEDSIWVYVPLLESNYRNATIIIRNMLGVNMGVTARFVPKNQNLSGVGPLSSSAFKYVGASADSPYTVATSGYFTIGIGHDTDATEENVIVSSFCAGGLLLQVNPASDPPANGEWRLTIMRSK